MLSVTLKRIIRAGYLSFRRNGWLSMAAITVMVMALFVIGNLIFLGALANTILNQLESKIDISIYFTQEALEPDVIAVKRDVEILPEVVEVSYVSKATALTQFREKHKANALIVSALDELGENPLAASLNIRARDPSSYALINDFLLKKKYLKVDKINYFENQKVIDRLGSILGTVRVTGVVIALILALVAILVAFNTIRIAIHTLREEIGIMKLVGATSWFIRGPFLVNGVFYGSIAALVTMFIFFPLAWLVSGKLEILVPGFNLFHYFLANLLEFFSLLIFVGVALGVVSSLIAVRKYLEA